MLSASRLAKYQNFLDQENWMRNNLIKSCSLWFIANFNERGTLETTGTFQTQNPLCLILTGFIFSRVCLYVFLFWLVMKNLQFCDGVSITIFRLRLFFVLFESFNDVSFLHQPRKKKCSEKLFW